MKEIADFNYVTAMPAWSPARLAPDYSTYRESCSQSDKANHFWSWANIPMSGIFLSDSFRMIL